MPLCAPVVNLFKRIEVIILLLLAVGGAAFVLLTNRGGDADADLHEAPSPVGSLADSDSHQLHRITLERDFGNARLDLEVRVVNRGESKLVLQPPRVKLVTTSGRTVPPFFLPFDPPQEVPAKSAQTVKLRYWLERADLSGGLKLAIGDDQLDVKSSASFDIETLENKRPAVLSGTDWKR